METPFTRLGDNAESRGLAVRGSVTIAGESGIC